MGNLKREEAGLTSYYYKVALRTYLLFEKDSSQILWTRNITLRDVQRITRMNLMILLNWLNRRSSKLVWEIVDVATFALFAFFVSLACCALCELFAL